MATTGPIRIGANKPAYVTQLESIYGPPGQAGFGSAVFYDQLKATDKLTDAALARYRFFVGDLWQRYGEDAWLGPWKQVYTRPAGAAHDIVAELRAIDDPDASVSTPMILDNIDDPELGRAALAAAYDDASITELAVFNIGDGGAMSGIVLAGRHKLSDKATILVFLMD